MGLLWNGSKPRKGDISKPFNFQHRVHAELDAETGEIRGLPRQWRSIISSNKLEKRDPLISADQTTGDGAGRVVGASSVTPLASVSSGSFSNSPKERVKDINKQRALSQNGPTSPSILNKHIIITPEHVKTALKASVDKTDPRNDLCDLNEIGRGTTGSVSQAYMTSLRRNVAVKRMNIHTQERPELMINEVAVMKRCSHPNVVQLYSTHLLGNELWICMELAQGGSLTNFLSKKRLREDSIATVSKQCLHALEYIHSVGIVHRDIKSDSILFTSHRLVKLSDFGFASILTDKWPRRRSLLGTPYWLAPEVAKREFYGSEIDIWSFGITVFEMICGEPPHFDNEPNVAIKLIKEMPPPTVPDDFLISEELKQFLGCMLIREPEERWTASQLLTHPFIVQKALADPKQIQL